MKISKVSFNDKIISPDSPSLTTLDAGLTYGLSVFETFRLSDRKVFLLDQHLERLYKSLDYLKINSPKQERLMANLFRLVDIFDLNDDLFVRLAISAGPGDLKLSGQNYQEPNIIIYAAEIPKFSAVDKPAKILSTISRQEPEYFALINTRLKTNAYLSAHLAQAELNQFKSDNNLSRHLEGIMLTPSGYIAEALTSNIFWVENNRLYTPPLSLGILQGTVRQYLLDKHEVHEKLSKANELEAADEIFLTNGVNYMSPLSRINKIQKPGKAGPVFKKLFNGLRSDIRDQASDINRALII